ncbi:MAG TPA: hypothetical protein VFD70_05130 [Anaerolineae bacterium]|nr:hypothetical protein [Anaerolineae bacterium]
MFLTSRSFPFLALLPLQAFVLSHAVPGLLQRAWMLLKRFARDNRGQDLVEYALIVAFAVGVVAVLTALYTTIKNVLTKANNSLQSAAGQ